MDTSGQCRPGVPAGWRRLAPWMVAAGLAACGGGGGDAPVQQAQQQALSVSGGGAAAGDVQALAAASDAVRLAHQASFGPSTALVTEIGAQGAAAWVRAQLAAGGSRYSSGGSDGIHRNVGETSFCDLPPQSGNPNCWRDWYSSEPLLWDFYRNALGQPDQLRQRVAFALQQVVVISEVELSGTYGLRNYHNMLLEQAFGNYRDLLRKVTLSPLMGDYLDHVNNDKDAPNENFARELLQLFSLGTCKLNRNGTLQGGACQPTYDNDTVRQYAYALTGWTYPPGGSTEWGCWPEGANCQYYGGDMVAAPALRNTAARRLLSGVNVPAGATAAQALEAVLDSIMGHGNLAPFVAQRLIQHLVLSNPSPAYVDRVAQAFLAGRYTPADGGAAIGTGSKGDLAATVAAVLLDAEARSERVARRSGGALRPPVLLFTGVLRALDGHTDGEPLGWWWGDTLRQHVFRPPSVFSFYPPQYPVAGTSLVGPEFGIHNVNTALERLNYLTYLLDWGGSEPSDDIPGATGTGVALDRWVAMADNAGALVDALSQLVIGKRLPLGPRAQVVNAVAWWTRDRDPDNWRLNRARTAAYLVLASPEYQVTR